LLFAEVALELGDEVAHGRGNLGGGHGLLPDGRSCQQLGGRAQPHVIPGQPGRRLGGGSPEQQLQS
jgi:hypothetical protein